MKKIALLRGINVGGHNKLKMADLKEKLSEYGYQNPATYLQSGNVFFDEKSNPSLGIKDILQKEFKMDIEVLYLEHDYVVSTHEGIPFAIDEGNRKKLYITFLEQLPDSHRLNEMMKIDVSPDQIVVIDKVVYTLFSDSFSQSKNVINYESKLGVKASTRNLNTLEKLIELSQ